MAAAAAATTSHVGDATSVPLPESTADFFKKYLGPSFFTEERGYTIQEHSGSVALYDAEDTGDYILFWMFMIIKTVLAPVHTLRYPGGLRSDLEVYLNKIASAWLVRNKHTVINESVICMMIRTAITVELSLMGITRSRSISYVEDRPKSKEGLEAALAIIESKFPVNAEIKTAMAEMAHLAMHQ
jgi:hypothetical protein